MDRKPIIAFIVNNEWLAAFLAAMTYILATSAWAAGPAGINAGAFEQQFAAQGIYQKWDLDKDGIVDEREFSRGFHGYYDEDRDEVLSEKELERFEKDTGEEGRLR